MTTLTQSTTFDQLSGSDSEDDSLSYIILSLPSNGKLSEGNNEITSDDLPKTLSGTDVNYFNVLTNNETKYYDALIK